MQHALRGTASVRMLEILYQLGVRPRSYFLGCACALISDLPRHSDPHGASDRAKIEKKLHYALRIYHRNPAEYSADRAVEIAFLARIKTAKLFETALAALDMEQYEALPLQIRIGTICVDEVTTMEPELIRKMIARGKPPGDEDDLRSTLDEELANCHCDAIETVLDGSIGWPLPKAKQLMLKALTRRYRHLVDQWAANCSKTVLWYPDGTMGSMELVTECYCPQLLWHRRLYFMDALELWLEAAEPLGVDTGNLRGRSTAPFEVRYAQPRPSDCRSCHWCQWWRETNAEQEDYEFRLERNGIPYTHDWYLQLRPEVALLSSFSTFWANVENPGPLDTNPALPGSWVD